MSVVSRDIDGPVQNGLKSFSDLINFLHRETSHVDKKSAKKMAPQIKSYVHDIYQSFYNAKTACEARVDELQRSIERIVNSISCCKNEIDSAKRSINELKIKEDNLSEKENNKSKYLSDCENILRDKERNLDKARQKKSDAERDRDIVLGVGAGISWIPIVGWIAGPTMMIVSLTALQDNVNNCNDCVNSARSTRDTTSNELSRIRSELSSLRTEISANSSKLESAKKNKQQKERKLGEIKSKLQEEAKVKEQLNKVFTFISIAFGKSRNLKKSVKNFYSVDQLADPMKELAHHFLHDRNATYLTIAGDFCTEMKKLESVHRHVSIESSLQDYC